MSFVTIHLANYQDSKTHLQSHFPLHYHVILRHCRDTYLDFVEISTGQHLQKKKGLRQRTDARETVVDAVAILTAILPLFAAVLGNCFISLVPTLRCVNIFQP